MCVCVCERERERERETERERERERETETDRQTDRDWHRPGQVWGRSVAGSPLALCPPLFALARGC